jgi:glycosyltransferase involved in cell wall biosynthesis
MLGEGGPFLEAAKRKGLTVVCDVYILLSTLRVVVAEQRAFPEWEPATDSGAVEAMEMAARDGLLAHSDFLMCPSDTVRDDLVAHWGVSAERTKVVPYGMHPRWLEIKPRPIAGRVLFVGTADLRKGIHYLAMAAERLSAEGRKYEFRVAGHASPEVTGQSVCRHLTFLGRVPRDRITEEFQQADVFVLPSLAEGSAGATYEALASGVPVVTTRSSGSVVRDGVEGRIVAERDHVALAEAITQLTDDRPLREQMAAAARERAADYTWERYGERLLAALQDMNNSLTTCQ